MNIQIHKSMILGDAIPAQTLAPGGGFESSELWMFQRTKGITHSRLKCRFLPHHWILFYVLGFKVFFRPEAQCMICVCIF